MTLDRLVYVDRLKQAGVEETVARAHAEALREAMLDTVATKADLETAISDLGVELKDAARCLDHKIELTARDLTIRGAGGLIVLASLTIGLELFG